MLWINSEFNEIQPWHSNVFWLSSRGRSSDYLPWYSGIWWFKKFRYSTQAFQELAVCELIYIDDLPYAKIGQILKSYKINHFHLCLSEYDAEFWIESEVGCLALYDYENHSINFINFENLKLGSFSEYSKTQDDYVIFNSDDQTAGFDVIEVIEISQDYKSLNLELIDKSWIVLHKDYIHKLEI